MICTRDRLHNEKTDTLINKHRHSGLNIYIYIYITAAGNGDMVTPFAPIHWREIQLPIKNCEVSIFKKSQTKSYCLVVAN